MQKTIAGLLGAAAALGTLGVAQAAPTLERSDLLKANSFAELLEPIPDAAARLKLVEESQANAEGNVQLAQLYYRRYHHHHHHHHHHFWRRFRHHHHHHHHHHYRY